MKKVIFETIGNICVFILLGIALTKGIVIENDEQSARIVMNSLFMILVVVMIVYIVLIAIINKKQGGSFKRLFTGLQLRKDTDERDKYVTGEAAKVTYLTAMVVVAVATIIPFALHVYEVMFGWNVNFYEISIWSPIIVIIILNIAFSVKWCVEYRK